MIMKLLLKEQSDLCIEKMVIVIYRKSEKVKTIYKSGTVLKTKSFYVVSCQDSDQNKSSKVKRIVTVDVHHLETYRHFSIALTKKIYCWEHFPASYCLFICSQSVFFFQILTNHLSR